MRVSAGAIRMSWGFAVAVECFVLTNIFSSQASGDSEPKYRKTEKKVDPGYVSVRQSEGL